MSIRDLVEGGLGVAVILLSLIQVSPIKIDPWTAIAKSVGHALNRESCQKLDRISKRLDEHIRIDDEREAKNARIRIIRFGDELYRGIRHSKDHFDQILLDIDDYQTYCDAHENFRNSITELTTERIKERYLACMKEGKFL